ncbi:hypothetical protein WJX81_001850 [Elliptochloris bilobata]|uniref:Secreted protein n=1 Tax=Elliptochloris bilobata TaxID=381761 RepID=A0AAW1RFH4_9CHLO
MGVSAALGSAQIVACALCRRSRCWPPCTPQDGRLRLGEPSVRKRKQAVAAAVAQPVLNAGWASPPIQPRGCSVSACQLHK